MPRRLKKQIGDIATQNFMEGMGLVFAHPVFETLRKYISINRNENNLCPSHGLAVVTSNGTIHANPKRREDAEVWAYVIAHCVLHLGFNHFIRKENQSAWNAACDVVIGKFLRDLKFGRLPDGMSLPPIITNRPEEKYYEEFCESGIPGYMKVISTAGDTPDMVFVEEKKLIYGTEPQWQDLLGYGLMLAVTSAVNVAAGVQESIQSKSTIQSKSQRARDWFITSYPLLGALATSFRIIEDPIICARLGITVAAVDAESREIFINPAAGLSTEEYKFVMAHEFLHVGLCHLQRREGRDSYLWNVACDYVINAWLIEMNIGTLPQIGALYDPSLKGESAEHIYDMMVTNMRRYRKLATLRGVGTGDMLEGSTGGWWLYGQGVTLDEFYRRSLSQGLVYHQELGRGYLPAGLIEEIRALSQPPIPWDVKLAQWFDNYFQPIEMRRSYARQSRRQQATPDIPRPQWSPLAGANDGRTFGVVLDTSGSMDRKLLANALGAIASYSNARDVPAVRVVFCDAAVYDQGYMLPDAIADAVKVRGRGGTVLQPAIDFLLNSNDFPQEAPLLIITDGQCDRLHIHREHAFLLPQGATLPFVARGEVFRIV